MSRRVFLHVGLPKTGTTYLQSVLWQNRSALREQGVLYPGTGPRQHMWASLVVREHPGLAKRSEGVVAAWDDLVEEVSEWPGTSLISHEFFGTATTEQAGAAVSAFGDAEVHLILTARDILTVTTSYWQEYVKHGFHTVELDDFPRETEPWDEWGPGTLDIRSILERWAPHVSPERVHVLVLPPPEAPRTALLEEFAAIVGIDVADLFTGSARANSSLGIVEVELLRRISGDLDGFSSALDRGVWIRSYLAQGKLVPRRGEPFLPSDDRVEELRRSADEAVDFLRGSGFSIHGDLEQLLVPAELPAARHPQSVTDSELLEAATSTINLLLGDLRTFRQENTAHRRAAVEPEPSVGLVRGRVRLRERARRLLSRGRLG